MPRPGTVINVEDARIFLTEASKYFANRPTGGEDRAYWANVYNSENCTKTLQLIESLYCALSALLGDVDYRKGACSLTEQVGAVINPLTLKLCDEVMAK